MYMLSHGDHVLYCTTVFFNEPFQFSDFIYCGNLDCHTKDIKYTESDGNIKFTVTNINKPN